MTCLFVVLTISIPFILIKDIAADLAGPTRVVLFIQLILTIQSMLVTVQLKFYSNLMI